jgi:hypothetical protein
MNEQFTCVSCGHVCSAPCALCGSDPMLAGDLMCQDCDCSDFTPSPQYWFCECCGHKDEKKPMPADLTAFYAKVATKGSPKCPKCRSEAFMPVGF